MTAYLAEQPHMLQSHTGLKSLVVIGRNLGIDISVDRILLDHEGTSELTSDQLCREAKRIGLKAVAMAEELNLTKLASQVPFVAQLLGGAYVVVSQVDVEAESAVRIHIFNPRLPAEGIFTVEPLEFCQHWKGEIILVQRASQESAESKFGLRWFAPALLRQKPLLRQIIFASLCLHVLALATPVFFQVVIDKVLVHQSGSTMMVLTAGVAIAIIFEAILSYLRSYLSLWMGSRIDIGLAMSSFRHLLGLGLPYFEKRVVGVVARHMEQTSVIREFLTGRLLVTLLDIPILLICLPILFFYNAKLTFFVLGITICLALLIFVLVGPYRKRLHKLYQAEADRQGILVESLHGMRTIKSLALERQRERTWSSASALSVMHRIDVGTLALAANTITQICEKLLFVGVVVIGAWAVFEQDMSVGTLVAFNMLAGRVTAPILQMVNLIHQFQDVLLSSKMLGDIIEQPLEQGLERRLTPALKGSISFDNVTFQYSGDRAPALKNVSVDIRPGAFVGVVGSSGSGKSTFSSLLQGLYLPQQGSIRFDNFQIKDIDLTFLRVQLGVVPQDVHLFRGTIQDNIRITRPEASYEEVAKAARLAGAHVFIEQLPQSYDTEIEEGGTNLSGGQRQRLSFARALLRDPRILILDEATSALDPESEAIILASLRRIANGRTIIMISHRLATFIDADIILVFHGGELVGSGKHDELLSKNTTYRQLWRDQSILTGKATNGGTV
jgi:ATP-binding cassette, subfamily B, bacterial HlyB/CyaB